MSHLTTDGRPCIKKDGHPWSHQSTESRRRQNAFQREYNREHYNPEERHEYYIEHREHCIEQSHKKRREQPEKYAKYRADYNKAHPLARTWASIKQRCINPKDKDFNNYGARGITLFPPWIDSHFGFATWINENLGPRPKGFSLDRIDNNGNYEPGNLRWADLETQLANRRTVGTMQREIAALKLRIKEMS